MKGQIEYRSRTENWRILWVTSPGDSTALSQCSYIWPAELRHFHSQTFILEMLNPCLYIVGCNNFRDLWTVTFEHTNLRLSAHSYGSLRWRHFSSLSLLSQDPLLRHLSLYALVLLMLMWDSRHNKFLKTQCEHWGAGVCFEFLAQTKPTHWLRSEKN